MYKYNYEVGMMTVEIVWGFSNQEVNKNKSELENLSQLCLTATHNGKRPMCSCTQMPRCNDKWIKAYVYSTQHNLISF